MYLHVVYLSVSLVSGIDTGMGERGEYGGGEYGGGWTGKSGNEADPLNQTLMIVGPRILS